MYFYVVQIFRTALKSEGSFPFFFKFGRYERANVSVYFLSSFLALTFKCVGWKFR